MEALPEEIADQILNLIFCDNPRSLYGLRRVSIKWKGMIDRCTARLLKIWCKKCSDEIPENILDDFIQTRLPQSWNNYCSYKLSMPHIAKDIYNSRNEIPNLVGNPHFTKICPSLENARTCFLDPAFNDEYFAANLLITTQESEEKHVVRIYSLDNLTYYIREYPISCNKIYFYTKANQVFLVLQKSSDPNLIFLAEFLINENLIPLSLKLKSHEQYAITKNECFIYHYNSNWVQHYQLTSNRFESRKVIHVPLPAYDFALTVIKTIQICNSNLFVFIHCCPRDWGKNSTMVVGKYKITWQTNGQLFFTDPTIFQQKSSAEGLDIIFGADNLSPRNSICDFYPGKFKKLISSILPPRNDISEPIMEVLSITIYAYHVIIMFPNKFIVFRGNFRQLMDYAVNNVTPSSNRYTVVNMPWNVNEQVINHVRVIHIESIPQFLIITTLKAAVLNFDL